MQNRGKPILILAILTSFKKFATIDEEEFNDLLKVQTIYKTMLSYHLKSTNNAKCKYPRVVKTKNRRIMLLSNFAV